MLSTMVYSKEKNNMQRNHETNSTCRPAIIVLIVLIVLIVHDKSHAVKLFVTVRIKFANIHKCLST